MARYRHLIIPIFIPFGGCPHQCVFCSQENITGKDKMPTIPEVEETVAAYLKTWRHNGMREVAFYGGTFTGLPLELQREYLDAGRRLLDSGEINGIRVSTRPDYITPPVIDLLKEYEVSTVELGVQSMDDGVLKLAGRGHRGEDTVLGVKLLREGGMKVGIQLMPGLPGDTRETVIATAREVAALKPDFVRVYPTLVIEETPLLELYRRGDYSPWTLSDMVEVCREVVEVFDGKGIKIIRVGLQPTKDLERSLVDGPYHPAFRELVRGTVEVPKGGFPYTGR